MTARLWSGTNQVTVHATRFGGLGFCCLPTGARWSFVMTDEWGEALIGGFYASKAELLSDLNSFAAIRGFTVGGVA